MSETKALEGEIQKANDDLKQVGKPGNYKWGVMVDGAWYGFFGTKDVLGALKKEYEAGAHHIKGTYKDAQGKDGNTYHNIEGANLSQAESNGETADERAMREELENTRPDRSLAGAKQGKAELRKEPPVQEERIGVEEVEALVDKHYVETMHRARRIIILAGSVQDMAKPWTSDEEKSRLLLAVFDKLAGPEVYVRADVEKYLMTKRVK